jgi:hypothetical protein
LKIKDIFVGPSVLKIKNIFLGPSVLKIKDIFLGPSVLKIKGIFLGPSVFLLQNPFKLYGFLTFQFWAYMMKVILSIYDEGYFEHILWRLFQKHVVHIKFVITFLFH